MNDSRQAQDGREHVVILGAGYLSIWSYRALQRHAGRKVRITVVAPATHYAFHGWTGEVLSGELPPAAQLSPLAEAMPKARQVRGLATQVDRELRAVRVELEQGGTEVLHYDRLVVGTGQYEDVESVPGMAAHAYRLRDAGKTGELVDHLDRCVEAAKAAEDELQRRSLLSVVVAGGGLAGLEAAVAVSQRLSRATRGDGSARVTLVSSTAVIAREFPPKLRDRIRAELELNGVVIVAPARVAEVSSEGQA